ncbi:MAG: ArsR family transcriptional regulator [Myxococcales bacterium]|nr:ArsR family transcriptional regulator [Myxococcales bacterium]
MATLNTRIQQKAIFFGAFAEVGKALGHPTRLELLDLLAQAPRTVESLAAACGVGVASVSQHLQTLFRAGLVARDKDGLYVTYRLASDEVVALQASLRRVARAHRAEVEQAARRFLDDGADEPVDAAQLHARMRRGEAVVLDVRPPEEYAAAHLPGAISVPLDELGARLARLPKRKEIVAYCRGPYCVLAAEAVRRLRASGRKARRLEEGVHEWRARGLPVEGEGRA